MEAQHSLGWAYANGKGVGKDDAESAKWYRKAAEQGHANAQNKLGFAHANGQGVPRDEAEAARWFRKAAEQGNATAQSNLGAMHAEGIGVPKDPVEAFAWYNTAVFHLSLQGEPALAELAEAMGTRDRLGETLSPAEIAAAQKRTKELRVLMESRRR